MLLDELRTALRAVVGEVKYGPARGVLAPAGDLAQRIQIQRHIRRFIFTKFFDG